MKKSPTLLFFFIYIPLQNLPKRLTLTSLINYKGSLESTSRISNEYWRNLGSDWQARVFSILFLSLPTYTQTKSPFPSPWQHVFPGTSQHLLSHRSESVIYPSERPKREREMKRLTEWVSEQHKTEASERERKRRRHRSRMMSLCLTTKHEISTATLLVCAKLQASETKMPKKRANRETASKLNSE